MSSLLKKGINERMVKLMCLNHFNAISSWNVISRRITMQVLKERTKYAGEIYTTVKIMRKYVILLKLGSKPRKKKIGYVYWAM